MPLPIRVVLLLLLAPTSLLAQLRIATWNTNGGARDGMSEVLSAIGIEEVNGFAKPLDVLSLQEQSGSETNTILALLNHLYGAGVYAAAPTPIDAVTAGGGLPGLIYNTQTIDLLGAVAFGEVNTSAQARSTLRYQLVPDGYGADAEFYLYSNHYKASSGSSNEARRDVEARAVRQDLDALGEGVAAILTGDFNLYDSAEPAYQTLLSSGPGQVFDPVDAAGDWHDDPAFKVVHTQSPTTTSLFGGQVTGGVDDRFDFQLVTGELLDEVGLDYWPGSYRTFGNNGTHQLSGDITTGTGASPEVLAALRMASDHLPVVVDYLLPPPLLAGDFNQDGRVDSADYSVWRTGFGVLYDHQDYEIWRANFGAVQAAASGYAAAPEPAAGVLLLLSSIVVGARRRG
ncbi:endonuclease/exonuclease/phosphatase family protein [Posidoniimonas polymericola]|nr:endonuclease/exonuclease/phosphatase family protein [Posidoniimonas polymericola]